jgi:choline-sulfatase
MLGEHGLWFKKHFNDHASRVPLIVHAPEYFANGRSLVNVSLVDLLPTLCDLAGLKVTEHAPQTLDGTSLVSQCEHPEHSNSGAVYAEITSEGVPAPMFMVRSGQFKLIQGGDVPPVLYDLANDPEERSNVVGQPELNDTRRSLESLIQDCWDPASLERDIRLSQRRRRLVHAAHQKGTAPVWDHRPEDPTVPWIHRGPELYNDWAWLGIETP